MIFSQINPYVRYARYLKLNNNADFDENVPLDARLFYAVSGYGKIKVKKTEYEMLPGSLLIINSGTPYRLITKENFAEYIAINFDYTQEAASITVPVSPVLKNRFKKDMLINYNTFDDAKQLSEVLYIPKIDTIQKKLTSIVREYVQKLLYYENKISHLLAECITDSIRFCQIGNTALEKESSNRILLYIHDNYQENISNISMGKIFGYHPNYVSYLIKHITGMPVHQYIMHVRLMNAVILLENSSLSISEIAEKCGFCDSAYFSGYFKKHFGVSPSKYRNF